MIIGAILQAAAVDYAVMFAAQIITGIGNGLNVSRHNKKFVDRMAYSGMGTYIQT